MPKNSAVEETAPAPRLYLMTPPLDAAGMPAFLPTFEAALAGGDVACVLVTSEVKNTGGAEKLLGELAKIAQRRDVALLVAQDSRLAARTGADGVHVRGVGDTLTDAIAAMKPKCIVGVGGLQGRDDAMTAGEQDIDYVLFGDPQPDGPQPSFEQLCDHVAWWAEIFMVPCVAFAQSLDEVGPLARAGADFVMLGEAVWDDPRGAAAAIGDAQVALSIAAESP